jgi:hypothetical protein
MKNDEPEESSPAFLTSLPFHRGMGTGHKEYQKRMEEGRGLKETRVEKSASYSSPQGCPPWQAADLSSGEGDVQL